MGNICPTLSQPSSGPTERSGLIANQHSAPIRPQQPRDHQTYQVPARQRDPSEHQYTAKSIVNRRSKISADTENPVSVKLKEHAKHWTEALFDSRHLQYDQISFLNLYNQLGRYAWELRSKTPPLRGTVAMTTQEEETFRRDLLVASLNSESNAFSANFVRLRRVDGQLGGFERLGTEAGERLAEAGRRLLLSE
uniref:Uncharacterized protein n=1 Tax=Macrostomum lignano TaxID=282301 RepID=A0A1I8H135_9PLAT